MSFDDKKIEDNIIDLNKRVYEIVKKSSFNNNKPNIIIYSKNKKYKIIIYIITPILFFIILILCKPKFIKNDIHVDGILKSKINKFKLIVSVIFLSLLVNISIYYTKLF
jgi:hypothetical protein